MAAGASLSSRQPAHASSAPLAPPTVRRRAKPRKRQSREWRWSGEVWVRDLGLTDGFAGGLIWLGPYVVWSSFAWAALSPRRTFEFSADTIASASLV